MSENFIENRRKILEEEIDAKIPSTVGFYWSETDTETILVISLPSYGHKFTVAFYFIDESDNYSFKLTGPYKIKRKVFPLSTPVEEVAKTIIKLYLDQIQEEKRKVEKDKYWSFSGMDKDVKIKFLDYTDKIFYKKQNSSEWYYEERGR